MNRTLRLTSSVVASTCGMLVFTVLHASCTGSVLTLEPDGGDASTRSDSTPPDSSPAADSGSAGEETGTQDAGEGGSGGGPCSTLAGERARWATMDQQPLGAWQAAGLNLGSMTTGITLTEAEAINCAGEPIPLVSTPDSGTPDGGVCDPCGHCYAEIAWGSSQEVDFEYDTMTGVVAQVVLNMGYTGAFDFWSDPKSELDPPGSGGGTPSLPPGGTSPSNHYHMVIGEQIQRNGEPFELDWGDPTIRSFMQIYNAMMYYYGSPLGLYSGHDDASTCEADQSCLFYPPEDASSNDNLCIFGVRPLRVYLETDCAVQLQPTVSTLAQVYEDCAAADYSVRDELNDAGTGVVLDDAGNPITYCADSGTP